MWSCRQAWGQPLRRATWSGAGARAGEEAPGLVAEPGKGAVATAPLGLGQASPGREDPGEEGRGGGEDRERGMNL